MRFLSTIFAVSLAVCALSFMPSAQAGHGVQICDNSPLPNCVTITGNRLDINNKPQNPASTTLALSIGTTNSTALNAGLATYYLMLHNPSATATLSCRFGGTIPVLNAQGTITLAPGGYIFFDSTFVPSDILKCIASAAATPMTIIYD